MCGDANQARDEGAQETCAWQNSGPAGQAGVPVSDHQKNINPDKKEHAEHTTAKPRFVGNAATTFFPGCGVSRHNVPTQAGRANDVRLLTGAIPALPEAGWLAS